MATRAIVVDTSPAEFDGRPFPFKEGDEVHIEHSEYDNLVTIEEGDERFWNVTRFIPTSDKDNLVLEDVLVLVNK